MEQLYVFTSVFVAFPAFLETTRRCTGGQKPETHRDTAGGGRPGPLAHRRDHSAPDPVVLDGERNGDDRQALPARVTTRRERHWKDQGQPVSEPMSAQPLCTQIFLRHGGGRRPRGGGPVFQGTHFEPNENDVLVSGNESIDGFLQVIIILQ
jgi:hypothetical protein